MKTYNMCNRPNACCPEISYDEINDVYCLFDDDAGWASNEITFEQLIQIRDMVNQIEKERPDIKDLDELEDF